MATNLRIEELRRRVESDPASIAFAQLAEEHRRAGDYEDAARVCRAGLEKHPSYLSARVTLGRVLLELNRFDEAETELQIVLQSAPENLAAVRTLAEVHQRRGNLPEALRQYQIALAISRHDPELEEAVLDLNRRLGSGPAARPDAHAPSSSAAQPPASRHAPAGFGEPNVIPLESLSPDLEAAADEFTRALQALDALSLDLPETPPAVPADLRISRAGTAPVAPPAPDPPVASAAPSPDDAAAGELESWLQAILRDRAERSGKGASAHPDLSILPDLPVNSGS